MMEFQDQLRHDSRSSVISIIMKNYRFPLCTHIIIDEHLQILLKSITMKTREESCDANFFKLENRQVHSLTKDVGFS